MSGTVRRWQFRIGDVFPADSPIAAWLVTLSMSLNDVVASNIRFAKVEAEAPEWERQYLFNIASMHLFEPVKHIYEAPRRFPEIERFAHGLSADAREAQGRLEPLATGRAAPERKHPLEHLRNSVAHYNAMHTGKWESGSDPIRSLLTDKADTITVVEVGETIQDLRFAYADEIRAAGFLALVPTEADQRALLGELVAATADVSLFIQRALDAWMMEHQGSLTEVEP